MLSFIGFLTLLFLSPIAFAGHDDLVNSLVNESQTRIEEHLIEANRLKLDAEIAASQALKGNNACSLTSVACMKEETSETLNASQTPNKDSNPLLVFVSLSMPFEALKKLANDAERQNAILILRGLKNNSFKETALILKDLNLKVNIDPALFEKFQIAKVPTFVYEKKDQVYTLSGNVSLKFATEKLKGNP